MEKTQRVYIYRVDKFLDKDYRVFPSVIVLAKNEEVEFVNLSGKDATLKVDEGLVGTPFTEPIQNNGRKKKKADNLNQPVVITYEVKVGSEKAEGNSDPVIIIDT